MLDKFDCNSGDGSLKEKFVFDADDSEVKS